MLCMSVETEDQIRTIWKMQRTDCQTVVDQNNYANYALKWETSHFHNDDDDDDVLFKVLLTVPRDVYLRGLQL